ncbi:unnamed protein product [Phytophthora lilii]|uniref:alcohol dehydrogenase n=1 Tax=Phytophthora lilii TaxID=2077276 RepID=A0A9W6WXC3_9STRA|nr:unnamed protein product [Phytophthora lilii]
MKPQSSYNIPKTQTAVMYEADNAPLQVRDDWPVVQPEDLKPGEVLVRIAYTGVCHSDLSVWEGEGPPLPKKFPMVGGHEGAGYIAAIGEHTRTNLKVGDAVGVKWLAHTCLGCGDCRKGYETTCVSAGVHGLTCHGSFQQWCVSFADHVTPIPEGLDLASAAPILCAGMTVYKALKQIGGSPGEYVVIPGAGGGLGHLACQYARAMGYKVVAIDTGDDKRKLIESYGIKDFIDFKEGNVIEQVRAATGGRGGHATIVVADSTAAYKDALMLLRPRGTLVAVGVPTGAAIIAPVGLIIPFEFRIVGSYVASRQDAIEALDLVAEGRIKSTYTVEPLMNLPDVFKRMSAGQLHHYDIPKTQTAVIYEEPEAPLQVRHDWPVTQPEDLKPGEVLVRLAYSGVCHSDFSVWHGLGPGGPKRKLPLVGGHEGTGYIAAVGAGTETELKVGDPVGVKWLAKTCLGCEDWRKGNEITCAAAQIHGYMLDGTFQQWCVSYADFVTPILQTSTWLQPHQCFALVSPSGGGLGHLACQYARSMGYRVVAIDTGEDRRKLIESYGIKDFIDFKQGNVVEQVRAKTDGRGAHAVVVVADTNESYDDAQQFLRPQGTIVAVGIPKNGAIVAPLGLAVIFEHRIVGSYLGNRQDAVEAMNLVAHGDVKTSYSIEPLSNLPDVFERMGAGKTRVRVVLDCE